MPLQVIEPRILDCRAHSLVAVVIALSRLLTVEVCATSCCQPIVRTTCSRFAVVISSRLETPWTARRPSAARDGKFCHINAVSRDLFVRTERATFPMGTAPDAAPSGQLGRVSVLPVLGAVRSRERLEGETANAWDTHPRPEG